MRERVGRGGPLAGAAGYPTVLQRLVGADPDAWSADVPAVLALSHALPAPADPHVPDAGEYAGVREHRRRIVRLYIP
ncbi:hypothetical protein AB0M32_09535 [Streptomyces sp. NPDC051985]|uniref:hypothetical protein n=1 Tax=Streptomyces sp. NPDC051985 TaxID=3155807 RepID=UPI00344500BC